MSSFASEHMSRDEFIQEMVNELKVSSDNLDLPRRPSVLMNLAEAVEELSYDWPEVHVGVLKTINDFFFNIPWDSSANIVHLDLYSKIKVTNSFFEGLKSCSVKHESGEGEGNKYRSNICAHLFFLLPYRIVQALTQGSIRKKNYVDKIFKIFDSWDVSVASDKGTNRHEHTNSVTQVFCLLQLLLQQGVIFAQENLISSSTWKSMSIVDALCNMIFLLTAKLKDIEDRDTGKFGNSALDALTNIIIDLLQDHCTIYSSDIPKLVKSMLPHVNENHISSKVLPLLGRVLSGENFMVKSGGKRSGKTMVDVAAVSQTVRQFDLKNLKKVNNFLKEFTLRNTPVDEFSQFMGTVSLCKFVATHTSSLNGAPDLLLQSGILQNFITLGLGLRKTNFLKRSKEKTSAKSIDTNIFSSPSWIISHNFILWYALNNHSFAIYMSKVNDFVDFVRDATYQSQKPIDALFWEVVFHFGTFVNNEKEGKKPTKCKFEPDCAIKTMEKIYPLEKNMEFETANSLYCFLERTITSKLLSSATGGCQANMPPFVAAFRSYCMRCQRMITRGEMDIFVLQAPKATSNENSKEEILSQKDVSKKRTLKTKYSKLFKKFLDQKDA